MIQKILKRIDERIAESENFLKENKTDYEAVLKNKDTSDYSEVSESYNFEAGVIAGLKELKQEQEETEQEDD